MAKSEKFSKFESTKIEAPKDEKTGPKAEEPKKTDEKKDPEPDKTDPGAHGSPTDQNAELGDEYADGETPDYGINSGQQEDTSTIDLPEADPAQEGENGDDADFEFGSGEEPTADTPDEEPISAEDSFNIDDYADINVGTGTGTDTSVMVDEETEIAEDFADEAPVTEEFAEEDDASQAWFPELAGATVPGFKTSHLQPIDGSSGDLSDSIIDDLIFEG